jgi:O-antigen ligase
VWQAVCVAGLVMGLTIFGALRLPAVQDRSFHQTYSGRAQGFHGLDKAGRDVMWPATYAHSKQRLLFGWGPGAARRFVASVFPQLDQVEYHPHNEYLQVLHDTGVPGLILLLAGWGTLLRARWREWRRAESIGNVRGASWSFASLLAILLVLLTAVTDNTLHYAFVTVPVFLLNGLALAWNRYGCFPTQGRSSNIARRGLEAPRPLIGHFNATRPTTSRVVQPNESVLRGQLARGGNLQKW